MQLPPELRLQIYDLLNLVFDQPLSIFAITAPPEVCREMPTIIREEMVDRFIAQNRFSITISAGLESLFSGDGNLYVSRIRRLRLAYERHGPIEG